MGHENTVTREYTKRMEISDDLRRNTNALTLGSIGVTLFRQHIFHPKDGFIQASVGGTFTRPFTRDGLFSGHFIHNTMQDYLAQLSDSSGRDITPTPLQVFMTTGGTSARLLTLAKEKKSEAGRRLAPLIPFLTWQHIWEQARDSTNFFWENQLDNGRLPHEMDYFDDQHALFKSGHFTYEDGAKFMVNADSIDATPRGLMEKSESTTPDEMLDFIDDHALRAFDAIFKNMDKHNGWFCYDGVDSSLKSQIWMDSHPGRPISEDGILIEGPVAHAEVQAYVWAASMRWADKLAQFPQYEQEAEELRKRAENLKKRFNTTFALTDQQYFAHALVLDAADPTVVTYKDERKSINIGLVLEADYDGETIINSPETEKAIIQTLTSPDMFDSQAGVFTFATSSVTPVAHDRVGYHYGKKIVWPFASVLVAEGIEKVSKRLNWQEGNDRAEMVYFASILPMIQNQSFLEQFIYKPEEPVTGEPLSAYELFKHPGTDAVGNKLQTWSLTAYLRVLAHFGLLSELDYGYNETIPLVDEEKKQPSFVPVE